MAGKYKKLRNAVPAYQESSSFQEKVEAFKLGLYGENPEDANVGNVTTLFDVLWHEKRKLEEQIGEINVKLEALSQVGLAIFESQGIDKMTVNETPIWLKDELYVSVPGKKGTPERLENDAKLYAWLKKNKMLSLRILTLPNATLRQIVGEQLLAGRPAPEGVKFSIRTTMRVGGRAPGSNGDHEKD